MTTSNRTVHTITLGICLAAALAVGALVTFTSPSRAAGPILGCQFTAAGQVCDSTMGPPSKAQVDQMWAYLVQTGYPSEITATNQADYDAATAGWRTKLSFSGRERSCDKVVKPSVDARVNAAKITYCEFKSHGFPVPKPAIVKGF